jgi:hypothetical protein
MFASVKLYCFVSIFIVKNQPLTLNDFADAKTAPLLLPKPASAGSEWQSFPIDFRPIFELGPGTIDHLVHYV